MGGEASRKGTRRVTPPSDRKPVQQQGINATTTEFYKCKRWRGQPEASNKNGIAKILDFVGMGPRRTLEALGKKLNALNTTYDHSESPGYAKLSVQGDIHCAPQRLSSRGCSRGGVQGYLMYSVTLSDNRHDSDLTEQARTVVWVNS